jgi:hypothetical protein
MLLGLWWFQELLLPLIFLYDFLCAAGSVCFLPLCIALSSSELVSIYLHILCPGKGIPKEPSQLHWPHSSPLQILVTYIFHSRMASNQNHKPGFFTRSQNFSITRLQMTSFFSKPLQ